MSSYRSASRSDLAVTRADAPTDLRRGASARALVLTTARNGAIFRPKGMTRLLAERQTNAEDLLRTCPGNPWEKRAARSTRGCRIALPSIRLMFRRMAALELEVWSDIACPWCYVGKRRLEAALRQFPHAAEVLVTWRSFELDSSAPREPGTLPHAERLARKYGMSVAQAQKATDSLSAVARAEGLAFDFARLRWTNTFDAHRLVHFGHARGVQGAVKERLLKAYFEQGELLSDHGTLVRLAVEAGLEASEATDVLASDSYGAAVRADEAAARELGISGVPCFVFNRNFAVSGAQSTEVMLSALEKAWSSRLVAPEFAEGAVCGPSGC